MRVHQSPRGLTTDGRTPTTGLLQKGLTICLSNKFQVWLLWSGDHTLRIPS